MSVKGATDWNTEGVDVDCHYYFAPSLAFDHSGHPAIGCARDYEITLAGWDGAAWGVEHVSTTFGVGLTSLAFDDDGKPALSFEMCNWETMWPYLARWNDTGWSFEQIDHHGAGVAIAHRTSLAFDLLGNPAISYYCAAEGALLLARWESASIMRGNEMGVLLELSGDPLPWTDPEPVLTGGYEPLLFYQVAGYERIAMRREGQSVTLFQH